MRRYKALSKEYNQTQHIRRKTVKNIINNRTEAFSQVASCRENFLITKNIGSKTSSFETIMKGLFERIHNSKLKRSFENTKKTFAEFYFTGFFVVLIVYINNFLS